MFCIIAENQLHHQANSTMFIVNHNNLHDLFQVANVKHTTVINTESFEDYGWKEKFDAFIQQRVKAIAFPIVVDVHSEYEITVGDDKFVVKAQSRGDVGILVAKGLPASDFVVDHIGTDIEIISKSIAHDKTKFDMKVTDEQLIPLVEVLTPETLYTLADCALRKEKIKVQVTKTLQKLLAVL